ncbi:hypothetical protein [Caulobacter sp. FWC2]|uniref:hypothetical protein n=1 Tax=Caulobacter sp. FWC2 TaxID=69664 RepID=UPI000C14A36E|nr:hypothetical protein [Caulobacter sp. FWC2]PIB91306.1 hypothetical protein CSW62_06775 [Caulobacter sp. FWC2]
MIGRIWKAMLAAGSIRQWSMILGAIPMTVIVGVVIRVVSDKSWGQPVLQLNILANLGYGPLIIIAIIFVALTGTSIAASVGKGGANISLHSDDELEAFTAKVEGDVVITPETKP